MNQRICLITGANSGIGKASAIQIAKKGYRVLIACRNRTRGETALQEIKEKSVNDAVELMLVDMSLQASVRELAQHFQDADTKVGVGTDGGTGITFTGHLEIEFEALHRYGYAAPEVLRMATLGNMEIMSKDDELGSIEKGKYADLVLLAKNPLEDIKAIQNVLMVFKDGRLVHKGP